MNGHNLPRELVDKITGFYARDHESLRIFSLIGPVFASSCRTYLFRDIVLRPRHFALGPKHILTSFDDIPELQQSIISLTISSRTHKGPASGLSDERRLALDPDFLEALLQKLSRLHDVVLEGCTIEPQSGTATDFLPYCRSRSQLRSLSISPSSEVLPFIDVFRIMAFFRRVAVDTLQFGSAIGSGVEPDPYGTDRHDHLARHRRYRKYVDAPQYELLRGWRIGKIHVCASGQAPFMHGIQATVAGLLSIDVGKAVQLPRWGFEFLIIWAVEPPQFRTDLAQKLVNLQLRMGRKHTGSERVDPWAVYQHFTALQTVTFIWDPPSVLERFGVLLQDKVWPNLPPSVRNVEFVLQLDNQLHIPAYMLLEWWGTKMPWARLPEALAKFASLQELRFGITLGEDVDQASHFCERLKGIVKLGLSDTVLQEKVRFISAEHCVVTTWKIE